MNKPLYQYFYVRSPIAKIALGILSVVITLVVVLLILLTEDARMEAQTGNWEGRSIEKGAALYANNCASCHGADGKGSLGVAPALHSRYFFASEADSGTPLADYRELGRKSDVGYAGSLQSYIMLTVAAGRPSKASAHWANMMPTWSRDFGGPLRYDQITALANYVMNWKETALAQTPAEDPWLFYQDDLAKGLPYGEDEPGFEQKLEQAVAAAEASGVRTYEIHGQTYEFAAAAANTGPRSPQELWVAMACSGCHQIDQDQTDTNRRPIAPHQNNLYERAGERVDGLSAEEYVYQSIVEPGAYLVEGYQNVMPATLAEQMSEEEIRSLVAWMLDPNRSLEVPAAADTGAGTVEMSGTVTATESISVTGVVTGTSEVTATSPLTATAPVTATDTMTTTNTP